MTNETALNWLLPYRRMAGETGSVLTKYLRDRGPHLAAMVAYYALLSVFPFLFLILSALGLAGQMDQSSYIVRELERILPSQSVDDLLQLVRSVQQNLVTEPEIDEALYHTLWTRFRLGLFDPAEKVPFSKYTLLDNDIPAHDQVALELARQSIVLLKNAGNALPLDRDRLRDRKAIVDGDDLAVEENDVLRRSGEVT